jgi:hypothetical protein
MMRNVFRALAAGLPLVVMAAPACAQNLSRRIESAGSANVQFHFAARDGVCGDGRSYIRVDGDSWYGSFNDGMRAAPCDAGPLRVVVVRAGREVVRIETYAGPLAADSTATDLGAVPAAEASTFLLSLISSAEGRVGRDAILPAVLADSSNPTPTLLALVRDQSRARELRRTAMNWLVRRRGSPNAMATADVLRVVADIARDERESSGTRQYATSVLSRFDRGEGIPTLIELTSSPNDPWLARQATEALGRSGDPRARRALRTLIEKEDTNTEVRVVAITALTNEYGTTQDAELVQRAYGHLTGDRGREAALSAAANVGGATSRAWLMSVLRDRDQAIRQRRKAAELLDRAGASTAEIVKAYDDVDDAEIRGTLIEVLAQTGTREATTKLLAIAKSDAQASLRRRAVNALGRFDDPRIRSALQDIVER